MVHIDPLGTADPLPFGIGGPPFAVIRVQPMAGGLCRYAVSSSEPGDEAEEDIVQSGRVPSRVIQTSSIFPLSFFFLLMDFLVHQFGLFEFKTGKNSLPSTPTHRSKASIFGLDAISRNLFNGRPGSSMGDFFSGSINGHRRNRSRSTTTTTSRSSMYTQTTTTEDSMKSSHRSNSTTTAATTMSTMDDDTSFFSSRSSKGKKLRKRSTSLVDTSDSEHGSIRNLSRSQSQSRSSSRGPDPDYSDVEDDSFTILETSKVVGSSDYNLAMQLELARQNSLNQHGKRIAPMQLDAPVESTIYEGGMRRYLPEMIILICLQKSRPIQCVLYLEHLAKYLFVLQLHDLHHPRRSKTLHLDSQQHYFLIHLNGVPLGPEVHLLCHPLRVPNLIPPIASYLPRTIISSWNPITIFHL